jgi:hypothetical protein
MPQCSQQDCLFPPACAPAQFNKWYRDFWEAEGIRPNANDIKA